MYQRNVGVTVGVLRRTLAADVVATSRSSSRAFSVSASRWEASNDDAAAPAATGAATPDTRKTRAANAFNQIKRLGANRRIQPGGLAKGHFRSGQSDDGSDSQPARESTSETSRVRPEGSLKITKEATGPPPGAMARAPSRLKLSRPGSRAPNSSSNATARRGPNLRGRDATAKPGSNNRRERGPRKRDRKAAGDQGPALNAADVKLDSVLSDGMIQHLMRLQRGEWDRKPYEPKYAPGSFAANQLVYAGRELCRGQSPPVKYWGALEKRIGVVGMHGAEAVLKVRRVPFENDEGLGERREHFETGDVEIKAKAPVVQSQ